MTRGVSYATPADAKVAWESMDEPNDNRVARKLTAAGLKVNGTTVTNWRQQGWAYKNPQYSNQRSVIPFAMNMLDLSLPAATGDVGTRISELAAVLNTAINEDELSEFQKGLLPLAKAIVALKDHQILIEAHRTLLQMAMFAGQIALRNPDAFLANPEGMGTLMKAAAYCVEVVSASLERTTGRKAESDRGMLPSGPKGEQTIYAPGEDPLDSALRNWTQAIPTREPRRANGGATANGRSNGHGSGDDQAA